MIFDDQAWLEIRNIARRKNYPTRAQERALNQNQRPQPKPIRYKGVDYPSLYAAYKTTGDSMFVIGQNCERL